MTTCREDVDKWIRSKEKKHAAAGLPLLGALHAAETLCGGDGGAGLHAFLDTALLRAFREPRHRAAAADALRAAVEGIAPPLPPGGTSPAPATPPLPEPTRGKLRAALGGAASAIKKGPHGGDVHAVARAVAATARLDPLLAADVLMDLVHQGKVCDATAAGLAAVPDVILLTASRSGNSGTSGTAPKPGLAGVLECMRDEGLDPFSGLVDRIVAMGAAGVAAAGGADAAPAAVRLSAAAATASALVKSLRRELGATASALQRADPTSRASVIVATALLRCVPFIAPEEWRGAALGEAVPPLCAHPHPAVRAAARDAMRRAVASTPAARDAIVQGAAGVLLSPPSTGRAGISLTDADAATSAARTLRDLCETWRVASSEEFESPSDSSSASSLASTTSETFDPCRSEAAGLLMMCSPHAEVRVAAVEMLREVAKLSAAVRHAQHPSGGDDSRSVLPSAPSMSSIVESCAGDMVLRAPGAAPGTGGLDPRVDRPLRGGGCRRVGGRRGGDGSAREGRRVDGGARRPRRSRLRVEPGRDHDRACAGAPAGPGGHGAGGRGGEERRTEGAHGFRHGYV